MKFSISLLVTFLFSATAFGQMVDSVSLGKTWISTSKADSTRLSTVPMELMIDGKKTTTYIENGRSASYPNNFSAFNADFKKEFKPPVSSIEKKHSIVRLSFIVERDSTLSSFEIIKSSHPMVTAEVIRTIRNMKKWIPAKMGGLLVRQRICLSFYIE